MSSLELTTTPRTLMVAALSAGVYKYFSDGVYKYFSDGAVYINTSPAVSPEKYLYSSPARRSVAYMNTSPAFFGAGEESGNCRPIYINTSPAIVCEIYPTSS